MLDLAIAGGEICIEKHAYRHIRSRRDERGSMPGLYPPSEPMRRVRSDSHPGKMAIGPFSGVGTATATRVQIPKRQLRNRRVRMPFPARQRCYRHQTRRLRSGTG